MTDTDAIERATEHRPWPKPSIPWVLFQSWRDLLFAHWRIDAALLRQRVPPQLELDLHEGTAWVGITPFLLTDFRPRGLPALPPISRFPELNLRTYVRAEGRAGIYFFSLDAGSTVAVAGARTMFRLPYHRADMEIEEDDGAVRFRSERRDEDARFSARYRATDHAFQAEGGSLEHFLTERYALFTVLGDGTVLRTDIHHRPWPLQPAEAEIGDNTLAEAAELPTLAGEPLLHFSRRQDTLVWLPTPAS